MGLPCFSTELSVILSLTICALTEVFSVIRCSRFIPLHPLYRLRLSLADSPNHADLIEFTSTPLAGKPVLRTDRSRRIAPHPVLPRRSYALIPHDSSPQGSGLSPLCSVSLQVALAPASCGPVTKPFDNLRAGSFDRLRINPLTGSGQASSFACTRWVHRLGLFYVFGAWAAGCRLTGPQGCGRYWRHLVLHRSGLRF